MIAPERRTADIAAGAISYLRWRKSTGQAVLFSHANGLNAQTYRTLLAPLADRFDVIAWDLRGHGFSTLPAAPGSAGGWTVFRDDLLAFLVRLGGAPLILAGHSLGATASLMAAAMAPSRVCGLVLAEPVLPEVSTSGRSPAEDLAQRAAKRRHVYPSFDAAFEAYRDRGIFSAWPREVLEDYLRGGLLENGNDTLRLTCSPEWEAEIFRETPSGLARLAGAITCPVTILHGTVGSTASASQLAKLVSLKPDATVMAVEGAGHFLPIERPETVREEIGRMAAAA
jgi:pimeloyl-ACP methyl ester carboxylesterase